MSDAEKIAGLERRVADLENKVKSIDALFSRFFDYSVNAHSQFFALRHLLSGEAMTPAQAAEYQRHQDSFPEIEKLLMIAMNRILERKDQSNESP